MNVNILSNRNFLKAILLLVSCAASVTVANAQQTDIPRYDAFAGFTDLNAPALGLNQTGFHTQVGVNMRRWYSLGFDYSLGSGSEVLKPSLLPGNLQAEIAGAEQQYIAVGLLPANYQLAIKTDAFTETFAAGPQLTYRHYQKETLFVRPSLGALRERATPHPADPFATAIAEQLAPAGYKLDWTGFYGVGGGGDFNVNRHFGVRLQMDAVYNHPFNDILANGRWTFRFSVGPTLHFGHNILPVRRAALSHSPTSTPFSSSDVLVASH